MCGITGIYRIDSNVRHDDSDVVRCMMDLLKHRGPDDSGFFSEGQVAFGHRRLSIIDAEGGHQPMVNDDGSICLVLNGEIYNYLELRTELSGLGCHFKTHSDTEVLLKLYERFGISCVERLNGMFAFAIWNSREHKLILCRDRLGIKPLYYCYDGKKLVFASEIKAIVKSGVVASELNRDSFEDYIVLQMSLTEDTLFKGVKKLLPGHILTISNSSPKTEKYWDLDFQLEEGSSEEEDYFSKRLLVLLEDAVRLQIRSDVPVGAHLSGGMDSSAVCVLASCALGGKLKTYTGKFAEGGIYDESSYAREVAKNIGADDFYETIGSSFLAENIEDLIYMMDEPQAGPGLVPQYAVSKLAKKCVKVVLSGLGGDETFGGYARYYLAYLEACLKGAINETQESHDSRFVVSFESMLPNLSLLKEYVPLMKVFWKDGLFEDPAKRYFNLMRRDTNSTLYSNDVYSPDMISRVEDRFLNAFNSSSSGSLLNKMLHFDLKYFIPALLQVEDRTSMAVSLESRVPLLDHRIVEFAAKIPPTIKWKGGRPKHIFKETIRHLVPKTVIDRKDKRGFPTPITEWFNGPLKGFVHEVMTSDRAKNRGIYNFSTPTSKLPFGRDIWGALCVELWHRRFVDK